jgi:hypothetical protein
VSRGGPGCGIRRGVADLNRIRARLPGARSEAGEPPEAGHGAPLQLADAPDDLGGGRADMDVPPDDGSPSDSAGGSKRAQRRRRHAAAEKRIAELEAALQAERQLREDVQFALELLQLQQAEDARMAQEAAAGALELRERLVADARRVDEAERSLTVLEQQRAEATRRAEEAERALELLQQRQADDARRAEEAESALEQLRRQQAEEVRTAAEAERAAPEREIEPEVPAEPLPDAEPAGPTPEPQPSRPQDDPAHGWGVPLEAFPITEREGEPGGGGADSSGPQEPAGPRRRLRRRAR